MCGFTGFWERDTRGDDAAGGSPEALAARATSMAAALATRGPDDAAAWVAPRARLAIGFRRLAVRDRSSAGRQPMTSHSGASTLAYNGELYNLDELAVALPDVRWRSRSDTEVLLEHIERFGLEPTLRKADGMFALALFRHGDDELVLARDRFGEKPLYFGEIGGVLFFGSQPKGFRAHPQFRIEPDLEALSAYARFGYVPAPRCAVRGLHKLGAGEVARARAGKIVEVRRWFSAAETAARALGERDGAQRATLDEVEQRLSDAVQRRLVSDVPLGALLSGGIDSSLVVALMQRVGGARVPTFSVGFDDADFDEAPWARAVARALGTEHHERRMTAADVEPLLPQLADIYDEPFGDSSQLPMLLLAGFARAHVTVVLSGDGGDEVFGGYARYADVARWWTPLRGAIAARVPKQVGSSAAALCASVGAIGGRAALASTSMPWATLRRVGRRAARELAATGPDALEQYYLGHMSFFEPAVLAAAREASPPSSVWHGGLRAAAPGVVERLQLIDQLTYLPDDILTKVDRATMAASLEARTPFLAPDVVDAAWRLPRELVLRGGVGKIALRELLARRLPRELFARPKQGFAVPLSTWLRGPLRAWADARLSTPGLERFGLLRAAPIQTLWQQHLRGDIDHASRLWAVLALQAWCERWL